MILRKIAIGRGHRASGTGRRSGTGRKNRQLARSGRARVARAGRESAASDLPLALPARASTVPVLLGPGSTEFRARIGHGRPLLPKVTRRPPRPARKPLLLFARACASRSQMHPHGPRARHCSPAPARKAPNLARCASHQHETAGGTCGGRSNFRGLRTCAVLMYGA